MDIRKVDISTKILCVVPLEHTLLQEMMSRLSVSSHEIIILSVSSLVDDLPAKEYQNGLDNLESQSQRIWDNGFHWDGATWHVLMAMSSAKSDGSMLLTSNPALREYFDGLMSHTSKTTQQLRMGYQLPTTPCRDGMLELDVNILIVQDEGFTSTRIGGALYQCVGVDEDGMPAWGEPITWDSYKFNGYDTNQAPCAVGDCHAKFSPAFAQLLSTTIAGEHALTGEEFTMLGFSDQALQYRLLFHSVPAMSKGTAIVSHDVPEGVDMVLPLSSIKLGNVHILPYAGKVWTTTITLGAYRRSNPSMSRFGSQFARALPKSVVDARKPVIAERMESLNRMGQDFDYAAQTMEVEANQSISITDNESGVVTELIDWFNTVMAAIARATDGSLDWLKSHPTLTRRIVESAAKKKVRLALGMGFVGSMATLIPDDTLPDHVVASPTAPSVKWGDGQWWIGGKSIPHRAVGLVQTEDGREYYGLLTVEGKTPIMSHAEQRMTVLVYRSGAPGVEWMSHSYALSMTKDFDGDRNARLAWVDEPGYIEAIDWFMHLERDLKLDPVPKEKSKVERSWGELVRLVYESAFEMGCVGTTSVYAYAMEYGIEYYLERIAEITAATQPLLDIQKYAPADMDGILKIVQSCIQYYQTWQSDSKVVDPHSQPYINRPMRLEQIMPDLVIRDVGSIAYCVKYVNSLHENPTLWEQSKPLSRFQHAFGSTTPTLLDEAMRLRRGLIELRRTQDEDDKRAGIQNISACRPWVAKYGDEGFVSLWHACHLPNDLVCKTREGVDYIPTAALVMTLYPHFTEKPRVTGDTYVAYTKDLPIRRRIRQSFQSNPVIRMEMEVSEDVVEFVYVRETQYLRRLTRNEEVVGYVSQDVAPDLYDVEVSPQVRKDGTFSDAAYLVRILGIAF